MERIAEMEAMREMITDQEENIKNKEVERENEKDKKKRNQLRDQIKRLKKALMEDMIKYSSTIKKWNKDDQKEEKGYEGDNEEGFGGGRKRRQTSRWGDQYLSCHRFDQIRAGRLQGRVAGFVP